MTTYLCTTKSLPALGSKGFEVNKNAIFIVAKDGEFHAYMNTCPHIGANLEFKKDTFLDVDQRYIQCSMHGALFEISSGFCVSGPCQGLSLKPLKLTVKKGDLFIDI